MVANTRPKPFYISIVEFILEAERPEELRKFGRLICKTEVLRDHDVIAGVFAAQAAQLDMEADAIVNEVRTNLQRQVQEQAERKQKPRRRR